MKAEKIITAYAWGSGRIEFTTPKRRRTVPDGALAIATGPARKLKRYIGIAARHGMGASAGLLLVPGVPEASMLRRDPLEAFHEFAGRVRRAVVQPAAN